MGNRWATRGKKPDRMVEAALIAAGSRFVKAIVDGEARPWIPALSHAIGAGAAMDQHRIVDRERANARNTELAEKVAGALNRVLNAADAEKRAATAAPPPASPTFQMIAAAWNQFVVETGKNPGTAELTQEDWNSLSLAEQSALCHACESHGVRLLVDGQDVTTMNPLLTR